MKGAENPNELCVETQTRLKDLFHKLDVDGDGRIDVKDLTAGLQKLGLPHSTDNAKKFIESSDLARDGVVDFQEFAQYVLEHERNLKLVFNKIDENADGHIDEEEIMSSCRKLGINIDQAEAHRLLRRMDKDGSLTINFEEWRDYLLFHPTSDLHEIISLWRHHSVMLDVGEDALVPDDFTEAELRDGIWWRHLVSGGVAGMVSRTCTAPLDRTKLYLQVHGKECGSAWNCLQILKKEGGIRGLWRGNGINVMKIAPESALKFLTYDRLKNIIRGDEEREILMSERFIAGALAGAVAQTIIYPAEVLKTRLALRKTGQYSGIWDAFRKIRGQEGWRALYRGYLPNLVGIFPYAGLDLMIYESLKNWYLEKFDSPGENKRPTTYIIIGIPLVSSSCGQAASYPLTLVRTRLQAANTGQLPKTSFIRMLINIGRHEGYRGLYRGFAPNALKAGPAAVVSYFTYETALNFFGVQMT